MPKKKEVKNIKTIIREALNNDWVAATYDSKNHPDDLGPGGFRTQIERTKRDFSYSESNAARWYNDAISSGKNPAGYYPKVDAFNTGYTRTLDKHFGVWKNAPPKQRMQSLEYYLNDVADTAGSQNVENMSKRAAASNPINKVTKKEVKAAKDTTKDILNKFKSQRGSVAVPGKMADWADKTGDAIRAVGEAAGGWGKAKAAAKVAGRFAGPVGVALTALDMAEAGVAIYKNRERIINDVIETGFDKFGGGNMGREKSGMSEARREKRKGK